MQSRAAGPSMQSGASGRGAGLASDEPDVIGGFRAAGAS